MRIAIWINYTQGVRLNIPIFYEFPVSPERVNVSNSIASTDFTAVNKTYSLPGNRNPITISWDTFFNRKDDERKKFIANDISALSGSNGVKIIEAIMGFSTESDVLQAFNFIRGVNLTRQNVYVLITEGFGLNNLPFVKSMLCNIESFDYSVLPSGRVEYSISLKEVL